MLARWRERDIFRRVAAQPRGRARRSSSTRARRRRTASPDIAPRAHARHQGRLPALQDDARALRRAQGRLGHARPAGRGRGREGARHPRQGRHRALRRRAVHAAVPRVACFALPRRTGSAHRADRASGSTSTTRTSRSTTSYVEIVWWALTTLFEQRPALRGPQGRLVVGAGRHRALLARGRRRATRTSTTRRSTCASRSAGRGRAARGRHAARLDDDAVDARRRTPRWRSTRSSTTSRTRATARCWPRRCARARAGRRRRGRRRASAAASCVGARYEPPFAVRRERGVRGEGPHGRCRPTSSRSTTAPASSTSRPRSARTTSGSAPSRALARRQPGAARRHLRRARSARTRAAGSRTPTPTSSRTCARAAGCCTPRRIRHAYPFCWRCGTPLIYYAQAVLVHPHHGGAATACSRTNETVDWHPEHIKHGRFGDLLENNVDWALSRERYWGTPLPVWRCAERPRRSASARSPTVAASARGRDAARPAPPVRRRRTPGRAPSAAAEMRRVPEVIDVWFDSGCDAVRAVPRAVREPGAVRGDLPGRLHLRGDRPDARLVLLAARDLDAAVRPAPPYRTVLCLGHIADPQGKKMSKSLGNIVVPWEVIDRHGADAFRWYFLTSQAAVGRLPVLGRHGRRVRAPVPAPAVEHVRLLRALRERQRGARAAASPETDLDRWALSRLHATVAEVRERMEDYDATRAGHAIAAFVDELSNWYVRRSRRRFWDGDPAAFGTLQHLPRRGREAARPVLPVRGRRDLREPRRQRRQRPPVRLPGGGRARRAAGGGHGGRARDGPARAGGARARQAQGAPAAARGGRGRGGRGARGDRAPRGVVLRGAQREGAALRRRGRRARLVRGAPELPRARPALRQADAAGRRRPSRRWTPRTWRRAARRRAGRRSTSTGTTTSSGRTTSRWPCAPLDGYQLEREGSHAVALELELDDELRREMLAREIVHAVQNARKTAGLHVEDRIELGARRRRRAARRGPRPRGTTCGRRRSRSASPTTRRGGGRDEGARSRRGRAAAAARGAAPARGALTGGSRGGRAGAAPPRPLRRARARSRPRGASSASRPGCASRPGRCGRASSVGIARIWYSDAVWMFSSVLSFTTLSSGRSPAISSRIGATMRHGPHHGAQKSTSTGWSASMTSAWKLVSVTSLTCRPWGAPFALTLTSKSIVRAASARPRRRPPRRSRVPRSRS